MNPSELENIWNEQKPIAPAPENVAKIAASICLADQKFRRTIWWRDLSEIGAALGVAAWVGFAGETWLRWIAVASSLFVAAVIIRSRIALRFRPEEVSMVDRLQQMIRETEQQIQLLRSVLWWYLLPIAIAMVAIVLDRSLVHGRLPQRIDPVGLTIKGVTMGLLFAGGYWLNQRAVRKHLEPRRAKLRRSLSELSQSS
jgi:uncharacterized membrane protein